ncbi:hypothetical protein B566_EDAN015120, partial [Ephemera danica]
MEGGSVVPECKSTCHAAVHPQSFYDNCLYDICQCQDNDVSNCLCPILANYVNHCQLENINFDNWRSVVKICVNARIASGIVLNKAEHSAELLENLITQRLTAQHSVFRAQHPCHESVKPNTAYADCIFDVCACQEADIAKCSCPILAAYGEECIKHHKPISWREVTQSCKMECQAGQVYQPCVNICGRTCASIAALQCKRSGGECDEGCTCPAGQALDDAGKCINKEDCPCIHNNIHRSVTVRVFKTHRIELLSGLKIKVNGQLIKSLPFKKESAYTIRRASNSQIFVTLWNSVEIRWDGKMAVYVLAPGTIYNEDTKWTTEDMRTSDNVEIFARSWNSDPQCNISHSQPKPCEQNEQKKPNAIGYCGILEERLFSACHRDVDVKSAVANCQYDTCASSETNQKDARCPVINAYVTQCSWSDVMLPTWLAQRCSARPAKSTRLVARRVDARAATYPCHAPVSAWRVATVLKVKPWIRRVAHVSKYLNVLVNSEVASMQVNPAVFNTGTTKSIFVKLGDNVDVWWDGATMVYIDVTAQLLGKTKKTVHVLIIKVRSISMKSKLLGRSEMKPQKN